ncbi:MAG: hypothetical protein Q9184_003889 [Pyrenodesmia sp. 2 TL-2023]
MGSAVESPLRSNSINKSGRSTPMPHPPDTTPVSATETSSEAQTLMALFNDFTQSVLERAMVQSRLESLKDDEKQIHDEHERWSKYFGSFVSIGEDQSRTLKATKTAKEKSQDQLNQARTRGEMATKKIVRSILAASAGKSGSAVEHEQIASLKEEIASLRKSAVDVKSDYHRVVEVQDIQQDHAHQLQEIWNDIQDGRERHNGLDKEVVDVSTRLKKLPTLSSVHDGMKHMSDLQSRHLDTIMSELDLKIKNLKESVENDGGKVTPAMLSKLEAELAVSREGLSTLQKSNATKDTELHELKALLSSLQQEMASNKASTQQLNDRETVNSREAKRHQQAVMQEAKSVCDNSRQVLVTCTDDIEKLRKDQEALGIRCDSIEQVLESRKNEQASASHSLDFRTDLSNANRRLGEIGELCEALKASEDKRDEAICDQIDQFNDKLIQLKAQFQNQESELGNLTDRVASIGADKSLENMKSDILELNVNINAIRDERTAQQPVIDQLQSTVSLLQCQASFQPQAQPSPSPSLNGVKDDVKPKFEALESEFRHTVDKVKAIETVQALMEQRWCNVTTEPMVQSVVYYMQQRYPLHALQDGQRQISQRQDQLAQVQEGQRNHLAQLKNLVDQNCGQDLRRVSELEKFRKETAGLFLEIRSTVQNSGSQVARLDRCILDMGSKMEALRTNLENQVARLDKSILDMGSKMEAMQKQEDPMSAQNSAAIRSIKTDVESLEEKYSSAIDSHGETLSDLKSTVQDMQKMVDSERLSWKAHVKALDDKVSEVYDVAIKDMVEVDRRVTRAEARVEAFITGPNTVTHQEVEETQQNVRETSTEVNAPRGNRGAENCSDLPTKMRTKRQTSQNSSNMPPKKKRKGPFSPDDSEAESYKGDQHQRGRPRKPKD